jgi:hypothetical protein
VSRRASEWVIVAVFDYFDDNTGVIKQSCVQIIEASGSSAVDVGTDLLADTNQTRVLVGI